MSAKASNNRTANGNNDRPLMIETLAGSVTILYISK